MFCNFAVKKARTNNFQDMKYIIDINERTSKGKALRLLLANEEVVRMKIFKHPDLIEEDILVAEMKKADNDITYTAEEARVKFKELRKSISK
jgi:hypothetical protein